MVILIDTREQDLLDFPKIELKERICLNVGDYSAKFSDDYVCPIVFERKNLGDLYGTLSQGYERFRREIDRSKKVGIKLIIIVEGTLSKVLKGYPRSSRSPISIVYQIFTLRTRHGIETVFCKDREEMAEYITQLFIAYEKEWKDNDAKTKRIPQGLTSPDQSKPSCIPECA